MLLSRREEQCSLKDCGLVNMLYSDSEALGSTSFVILLISPDKGMIWQFVREQHYHLVEEHFLF